MPESRQRRRRGRPVSRATAVQTAIRPRRKVNKLYLAASALIAVLVIAGFAISDIGGGRGQQAQSGQTVDTGRFGNYVEGIGLKQELMPTGPSGLSAHVLESERVVYSTVPPTSGDHWATPSNCGFFEGGLPDERIVHNLEHGNIVVSYNLATDAEILDLRFAVDIPLFQDWGVVRSYDGLEEGQVALATWGVSETMQGIDPERIANFFEYAGNLGPETVTCSGAQAQHLR